MKFFPHPILAIETSCDETSAAVIEGSAVRSNIVASQIEMHQKWGGVVPEAAARAHVESLIPTIQESLTASNFEMSQIRAIAVTNRPGLVGALSVGVSSAKALSLANRVPLIGIHHLEGHLSSVFSERPELELPFVSLIASGGHTELVLVNEIGNYQILGETIDDAAGEAFDKGARAMGLGYPGGRAIQKLAKTGDPKRYPLPIGLSGDTLNFSFSGLKTAVLRLVEVQGKGLDIPDAAASLQNAVVKVLVQRSIRACIQHGQKRLTLVGGVAANEELRRRLALEAEREGIELVVPPLDLCTDNAAMIGLAASIRLARGEFDSYDLAVLPNEELTISGVGMRV